MFSWFSLDKIRFEDNHLSLTEYFTHGYGALEFYISDLNLQKAPGFYYYKTSESDFCGCTNDAEAKYFKRFCEYVIIAPDFKDKRNSSAIGPDWKTLTQYNSVFRR